MEKGIKDLQVAFKAAQRRARGMHCDFDSGLGEPSDTDAEYESENGTSYLPTLDSSGGSSSAYPGGPTTAYSGDPSTAYSGDPSTTYPIVASAYLLPATAQHHHDPATMHHHHVSAPMQLRDPTAMQSMPNDMIMRGRTMDPSGQGRGMSIHAMLSPSPPAQDEGREEEHRRRR